MKIYVIGDSISLHYGPFLKEYLRGIMEYSRKEGEEEAMLNLDKPQGANGGDSSMVLSFLKAKAASGGVDADVLLVNCGLHDIRTNPASGEKQIPVGQYEKNLKAIVKEVAKMKHKLVWIRTTPCDEETHNKQGMEFHRYSADCAAYNEVADKIMTEASIPIIDLYNFTMNIGAELYCDHVHFQEHVRQKQAAFLAGWLSAWRKNKKNNC